MAKRGLARVWGMLPYERLKTAVLWAIGPRFLVSVLAIIFDRQGRVLLLRHTHDSRHAWGLPSGRLERSETLAQALVRELVEETGLTVQVQGLVAVEREVPVPVLRVAYVCRVAGGAFRPSVEVSEARYFPPRDLPSGVRLVQRRMIRQAWEVSQQFGQTR